MADFSNDEMLTFRRQYIRDFVSDATSEYLSYFNLSYKKVWITDADINALKTRVERDYHLELESVYDVHYDVRLDDGDSPTNAGISAAAQKLDATMRLIRAEVREAQINDSGYLATISDASVRAQLIKSYQTQVSSDRHFMRARAGAPFSAVQVRRG